MQQTIIHVGLDIDDTQYHGSALDKHTGEVIDFKCRQTLKGLLASLKSSLGISRAAHSSCARRPRTSAILCNGISRKKAIIVVSSRPPVSPAPEVDN